MRVLVLLALVLLLLASITNAQQGSDDDNSGDGDGGSGGSDDDSGSSLPAATTMVPTPTSTLSAVSETSTATPTVAAPVYSNVVLDLSPTYQPNFFLHMPVPSDAYAKSSHPRLPDIYFRDCNRQADSSSIVEPDLRINITAVYSQFDDALQDSYMGRKAPTKGTLRIVAVGEIGAQAHAADNVTNYLSAISIKTTFLTFPVFANLTYLCDRIFPTIPDPLNPLINPPSCAYGPGPVAFGVAIPVDSPYYLGSLQTQLRLSDPFKPAKDIACISVRNTPYRPKAWYWSFMLWLPIATFIAYFVLGSLARLLNAFSVLRARFANRAREGAGPSWIRDKLRPTLAAALSGEHLQQSAGLLRFASPGCWDVIYHLQFVAAVGMIGVHWPDWAYPFLKQAAWASLLGNVTVLNSNGASAEAVANGFMPSGHIDVLRTFTALPQGDIGDQIRNNASSPLYMNTNIDPNAASYAGGNRLLNLNDTAYGIPRFGYMVGLREEDIWPTAAVIWFYLLAAVVAISFLLWLADWLQARIEAARHGRQIDDLGEDHGHARARNGTGGGGIAQSESSAAILAPRSPAASTATSLNYGNRASTPGPEHRSGPSSGNNIPTLGSAAGRSPNRPPIQPLGSDRRGVSSLRTSADGFAERRRDSASDMLGLAGPGTQGASPYEEEPGRNKELGLAGASNPPSSRFARLGQYRFLGSFGTRGEKANTPRSTSSVAGKGRPGAPARLHLSALHGNVIRVVALFHFPLTILSVWGFQSHGGTHSTTQRALAGLFFAIVCVLIPLYAVGRIVRSTQEELYEDMPTFIQLGPLYNSYAPGQQRYVAALFAWTLIVGIVIGAAGESGSAQALVLLIFEIGMSVGSSLWLPWGERANMGPVAFIGSVLRIITAVLLVLLSPLVGFGAQVAGWITYVILLAQAIWLVGACVLVIVKAVELLVRIAFNVPYEEGSRTTYSGLAGAIRQIRRRQDKILQLGSGLKGGVHRPANSRSSTGSGLNLNGPTSTAGKPIQLTHSRQVSYASYLDNHRMGQQSQHRLSQQGAAMYGPYAGYFQADPHDEGGIMAAMPPSSPGLYGSSTAFSWGGTPAPAPISTAPGMPQQGARPVGEPSASTSPPSTGFVRLGGGRATDAQPWQSIPGTSVTARPLSGQNMLGSGMGQGGNQVGASSSSPPVAPSAGTAAAVAAARRRPRPQSETAVVGLNWAEHQGATSGLNSPPTSPHNDMVTLPDHRSSFNALAQRSAVAPPAASRAGGANQSGGNTVDSTASTTVGAEPVGKARKPHKSERRFSAGGTGTGGGGFWMRTKALGRRRISTGQAAEDSFDDDDDEDEEDMTEEGFAEPGRASAQGRSGGFNNAASGGKVWTGLKNVVGGLRTGAKRDGRESGGGLQTDEGGQDDVPPATTGFEVVRAKRPVLQQAAPSASGYSASASAPGPATGTSTSRPTLGATAAGGASASSVPTAAATTAPTSPIGDGSLPPQTDLGKLNAGLGLDFAASISTGSPTSPVGPSAP